MSKFTRWSRIAHTILVQSHPKIKLGQTREILAAYLGHRSYASLQVQDIDVLDEHAKYVLVDPEFALIRARRLNTRLSPDDWNRVEMALKPSGVTGKTWLIREDRMHLAASFTITDANDSRLNKIISDIGMGDGYRSSHTQCHSPLGEFPRDLRFTVEGEIRAFNDAGHFAVPVVCEVSFPRVGNRFYGVGQVESVAQRGEPKSYEAQEPQVDSAY